MGKITLYHPVGLMVIRGACQYGGIRLGRIVQYEADKAQETAHYVAEIVGTSAEMETWNLTRLRGYVNALFGADIHASLIWQTRGGRKYVRLDTCLNGWTQQEQQELLATAKPLAQAVR